MNGLKITRKQDYLAQIKPMLHTSQAVKIYSKNHSDTLLYRLEKGSVGVFETLREYAAFEVYHLMGGTLELRPLGETPQLLHEGDFFMLDNTTLGLTFFVPEACTFVCYASYSFYDRDEKYTDRLHRVMQELEEQDGDTAGHCERVKNLAMAMAERMHYTGNMNLLLHAARFHDIGKAKVPLDILIKPEKLTPVECAEMKKHSVYAAEMLGDGFDNEIAIIVRQHHERVDGTGYPDGLKGEQIHPSAKIIAVAEAFDAMVTPRPYNEGKSRAEALGELRRCTGTQFDPACVETLCTYLESQDAADPWANDYE